MEYIKDNDDLDGLLNGMEQVSVPVRCKKTAGTASKTRTYEEDSNKLFVAACDDILIDGGNPTPEDVLSLVITKLVSKGIEQSIRGATARGNGVDVPPLTEKESHEQAILKELVGDNKASLLSADMAISNRMSMAYKPPSIRQMSVLRTFYPAGSLITVGSMLEASLMIRQFIEARENARKKSKDV